MSPKKKAVVIGSGFLPDRNVVPDIRCTLGSFDQACEFDKKTTPHCLHEAALMRVDGQSHDVV